MIEQQQLITKQQQGLLRQLGKYQPVLQFQSLADLPLPSSMHNITISKQSSEIHQQKINKNNTSLYQPQQQLKEINPLYKSININHNKNNLSLFQSNKNNHNIPIPTPSTIFTPTLPNHTLPTIPIPTLQFLHNQLQKQTTPTYIQLKSRLLQYKQQSQRIYIVSQFINQYEQNFTILNSQKDKLLTMLKQIKGQTTQLVQKQKCLIDMSMAIKQALDYYTYYTKSQFNYACQIASRQLFQNTLQPTLSTIMDSIQFFTENQTYVQSRKHLNFYLSSKSKILSFIKSFFIKLLNKQNSFIIKHIGNNNIYEKMNTLYPKSKLKLIKSFLLTYPLLKNNIKQLTKLAKQSINSSQEHNEQMNYLQLRQMQIQQFVLSQSNLGLIKYLEKNNYQIYSQVMLNLFTFNRFNFHQNLIFYWNKVGGSGVGRGLAREEDKGNSTNSSDINHNNIKVSKKANNDSKQSMLTEDQRLKSFQTQSSLNTTTTSTIRQPATKKQTSSSKINTKTTTKQPTSITPKHRLHQFHTTLHFITQTILTQYIYILTTCNPSTAASIEFITTWLYKLVMKYLQTVVIKQIRQLLLRFKVDPFEICEVVDVLVDYQLKAYLGNLMKQQYKETYVMGRLYCYVQQRNNYNHHIINKKHQQPLLNTTTNNTNTNNNTSSIINQHTEFLHQLFTNTLKTKLLIQLSFYCLQNLPKLQLTSDKPSLQQNINLLINYIPKLQYCSKQADNYLITSLDTLIKSIKQINLSIQSRFQCYVWNLIIFGRLKHVLNIKKLQLVSKQIRLDFNQSLNIIDRVKRLQRPQSLIKYAQDIFNVIKTGIPSLNQLTLDYSKYINQHYDQLQSRFLKDILFIYAKNIIQFLQKIIDTKKRLGVGMGGLGLGGLGMGQGVGMGIELDRQINSRKSLQQLQSKEAQQKQEQKGQQSSIPTMQQNNEIDKSTTDTPINRNKIDQQQKSPKSTKQLQKSTKQLQKSQKQLQKSPKQQQQKNPFKSHPNNELFRLCESQPMKSLYHSYLHSIEKYIKQSKQILQTIKQCRITNNEKQVKNINNLIREVYQKLFDFLDTFYVTVSEFNSEITSEFQQIAVIKQRQEKLWMERVGVRSVERVIVVEE